MANPPPIPPPPAGFGWRTLACLADIVPLLILGTILAGMMAGPEELAARRESEEWADGLAQQFAKAGRTGAKGDLDRAWDMLLRPKEAEVLAVTTWYSFQGYVSFAAMFVALALQEWLLAGRTLGKRIFRLRAIGVPEAEGPGLLRGLLRSAWKAAFFCLPNPFFALLGIVNFHIPLFRRDRRAWHDRWTGTQVVEDRGG